MSSSVISEQRFEVAGHRAAVAADMVVERKVADRDIAGLAAYPEANRKNRAHLGDTALAARIAAHREPAAYMPPADWDYVPATARGKAESFLHHMPIFAQRQRRGFSAFSPTLLHHSAT